MKKSGKKSTSSSRLSMPNIRSTEQLMEQVSFNPLTTRIPYPIAVNWFSIDLQCKSIDWFL